MNTVLWTNWREKSTSYTPGVSYIYSAGMTNWKLARRWSRFWSRAKAVSCSGDRLGIWKDRRWRGESRISIILGGPHCGGMTWKASRSSGISRGQRRGLSGKHGGRSMRPKKRAVVTGPKKGSASWNSRLRGWNDRNRMQLTTFTQHIAEYGLVFINDTWKLNFEIRNAYVEEVRKQPQLIKLLRPKMIAIYISFNRLDSGIPIPSFHVLRPRNRMHDQQWANFLATLLLRNPQNVSAFSNTPIRHKNSKHLNSQRVNVLFFFFSIKNK